MHSEAFSPKLTETKSGMESMCSRLGFTQEFITVMNSWVYINILIREFHTTSFGLMLNFLISSFAVVGVQWMG